MKFNKYLWNLYKSSEEGNKTILESTTVEEFSHLENLLVEVDRNEYDRIKKLEFEEYIYENKLNIVKIYHHYFREKHFKIEEAEQLFNEWISEGIIFNDFEFTKAGSG